MATNTNNFTRSNVNAATLQITDPARSSFNLGHRNELTLPFGKIVPVNTTILLASDTFSGSIKPNFHLEKIATPSIGATRLDTHTFVVNFRRINKDMRKNLENGSNFFPSVNIYYLIDKYVGYLLFDKSFADAFIQQLNASSDYQVLMQNLLNTATNSLVAKINNYDTENDFGYQLDKFHYLYDYYKSLSAEIKGMQLSSTDPRYLFQVGLPGLLKPFMGESSLLDYLGYPTYTQYNKVMSYVQTSPNIDKLYASLKASITTKQKFISIISNGLEFKNFNTNTMLWEFEFKDVPLLFSELPIRAYYTVWYDYLRNWHIEERSNILDPDNFDNKEIVDSTPFTSNTSALSKQLAANKFLMLYTLRSRDYGTDFLTSIQTDDVFRHVYSPVFQNNNSGNYYTAEGVTSDQLLVPQSINKLIIESETILFPSDGSAPSSNSAETYAQDLQTMRRAGMLERWLARNYYYPDTYVGRLQARFGVRPSDYEILVSQYIGGSESFITGQELVANMSTSQSVVGSRNLKADVSTMDNFSGSVSDYSILISVVSTVPIVTYDSYSTAAKLTDFIDFPQPEFATDTRVEARASDFLRGFSISPFIGYVPRYYMFRVQPDESHGRYLTDYRVYNWLRDNYSMSKEKFDFSLNPYSLRVNLPLDAFIGLKQWDDFAYGSCDCKLVVNRALPAAIEII